MIDFEASSVQDSGLPEETMVNLSKISLCFLLKVRE